MTTQVADLLYKSCWILSTPYEQKFDPMPYTDWTAKNHHIPFVLVAIYFLSCFTGQYIMKSQKAFDLRMPLAAWNAVLCLFSFIGMCRTVPNVFANLLTKNFDQTICESPDWAYGPTGFWTMLFIFSKIPELIDTLFIVLRKKPLIFLHWYHHITVLLFCWNAFSTRASSGIYFVAMNFSVHALMYGYYCLQSLNMVPKSFPSIVITMAQIAQMFIGTFVCCSAWYFKLAGRECNNDDTNLTAGALMYGSYLYLFIAFAFSRYTVPAKGKQQPKKDV